MAGKKGGKKAPGVSRSVKAGVNFPVGRLQRYIKKGLYARRVGGTAAVYMAAALEYVVAEIVEAAADVADEQKKISLTPRHIQLAIRKDDELAQLFANCSVNMGGVVPGVNAALLQGKGKKAAEGTQQM